MRKLLYIFIVLLTFGMPSCKTTTKIVTLHDTLTIERSVMQEVYRHDTTYKHDTTNVEIERVLYDTLERIKEVQRVIYRNGKVESRSEAENVVVRDTVYISQGSSAKEQTKQPKQSPIPAIALAVVMMGVVLFVGYKTRKL